MTEQGRTAHHNGRMKFLKRNADSFQYGRIRIFFGRKKTVFSLNDNCLLDKIVIRESGFFYGKNDFRQKSAEWRPMVEILVV